jgi:NAD(P)H-hydrate epimerase
LGALLARGVGLLEAACAAAYINGKAGELAAEKKGEGVVASDIFEFIPEVTKIDN